MLEFQQTFFNTLTELPKSDSVLLPSSWSGHAIAFEFLKQSDELIRFRMFNTGVGINKFHQGLLTGYEISYKPFVQIDDIPIKNIASLTVLKGKVRVSRCIEKGDWLIKGKKLGLL